MTQTLYYAISLQGLRKNTNTSVAWLIFEPIIKKEKASKVKCCVYTELFCEYVK
jgi:hypothetical protein